SNNSLVDAMKNSAFIREDVGGIDVMSLNRPDKANAITIALAGQIVEALRQAAGNAETRAVVLAAASGRVFSGGMDVSDPGDADREEMARLRGASIKNLLLALLDFPKPLVVA